MLLARDKIKAHERGSNMLGKQKGAALIVTLVLLVVSLMLGLSSFQSSRLEESMAGNQRAAAVSLMAAEYGASLDSVYDFHDNSGINFLSSCNHESFVSPFEHHVNDIPVNNSDQLLNSSYYYEVFCREFDSKLVLRSVGVVGYDENYSLERNIDITFRSELLPAFGRGMLANGDIRVNGGAKLYGDVHSNSDVNLDVSPDSESNITASGSADIGSGEYENVTSASGAGEVETPLVSDFFNEGNVYNIEEEVGVFEILELSGSGGNQSCNLDVNGDLSGITYFCPGRLVLSGSFNNATFFADGDVDHNGSSNLSDSESVDVGIFSTGNIEFNGQSDAYGVFWSDGSMTQNGSSVIGGSMISGESMTLNGGFTFISNSDISVDSVPSSIVRDSWKETL